MKLCGCQEQLYSCSTSIPPPAAAPIMLCCCCSVAERQTDRGSGSDAHNYLQSDEIISPTLTDGGRRRRGESILLPSGIRGNSIRPDNKAICHLSPPLPPSHPPCLSICPSLLSSSLLEKLSLAVCFSLSLTSIVKNPSLSVSLIPFLSFSPPLFPPFLCPPVPCGLIKVKATERERERARAREREKE